MNEAELKHPITTEIINSAMSYQEYTDLLNVLFEQGKTTGTNHSEAMLGYAKMNIHRMKRLNKTVEITEALNVAIKEFEAKKVDTIWLVITEGWCGDAAQNLPIINKLVEGSNTMELKLILRDENLAIMDAFLTNGGRSIPKLIVLNKDNLEVLGTWGPRPAYAQKMSEEFRKIPNGDYSEFNKEVQLWYAKDKTQGTQSELTELVKEL